MADVVVSDLGLIILKTALINAGVGAREASAMLKGEFAESTSKTSSQYEDVALKLRTCAQTMDQACTSLATYISKIVDTLDGWDQEYARKVEEHLR